MTGKGKRARAWISALGMVAVMAGASAARAQDSVNAVAGAEYGISGPLGWLDRWLFGERYRALWTDTVRARLVLTGRPARLHALGAGTGLARGSLYLRSPADSEITFRLTDPPLGPYLAEELGLTTQTGPAQDLVSALHPGAALIAPPLARASGARQRSSDLAVLAADSDLGALNVTFGGQLGYLQPNPSDPAAITTATLIERMRASAAVRVDARAFLRERLFDVYVGEASLFPTNALWTRGAAPEPWTPAPRDRELAFARFDGLATALGRIAVPTFLKFGPQYDNALGETAYLLAIDRQLLGSLEWPAWDSVARGMRDALTDSVIGAAAGAMPGPWYLKNGSTLESALRVRRDHLVDAARRLYLMLAKEPDVYAAAGAESVEAVRDMDGALAIAFDGFSRRYVVSESKVVHLYLLGAQQVVRVTGSAYGGPRLAVHAEGGPARIVDSSTAVARTLSVTDPRGVVTIDDRVAGARPSVSSASVELPVIDPGPSASAAQPVDGARYGPLVWLDLFGDLGLLIGGGVERIGYGRGYAPFKSRQRFRAAYATQPNEYAVEYHGEFRYDNGASALRMDASRSGIALLKFYGYGNETVRDQADEFYSAKEVQYLVAPSAVLTLGVQDTLAVGPVFKEVNTSQSGQRYITIAQPYGYPEFREVGVQATIRHDTRDSPVAAESGWLLIGSGKYFPAVFDAKIPFGGLRGAISTYWTPGETKQLTFAVRVAGEKLWGPFPVFEAAYLGGPTTVRGLRPQRYAGDASAYGNLEARMKLTALPFVVRWDFGVSGILDVGRVWVNGETSDLWHIGVGGGIWALLPDRSFMVYCTLVRSSPTWGLDAGTAFIY